MTKEDYVLYIVEWPSAYHIFVSHSLTNAPSFTHLWEGTIPPHTSRI